MMVDTTVYGYIGDGEAICMTCSEGMEDLDTLGRLYSTDDTSEDGLSCDVCGAYIFDPDFRGQWVSAIEDLLLININSMSAWARAERILSLFEEGGFTVEGAGSPNR